LLDFYEIERRLAPINDLEGVAPRWVLLGKIFNPVQNQNVTTNCYVIIGDTKKERDIGLGRNFDQSVLTPNEAFVSASAMRVLGINDFEGERVGLSIDLYESLVTADVIDPEDQSREEAIRSFLESSGLLTGVTDIEISSDLLEDSTGLPLGDAFTITIPAEDIIDTIIASVVDNIAINVTYTVVKPVEEPNGKWPTALGNVIFLDVSAVNEALSSLVTGLNSNNPLTNLAVNQTLIEDIQTQIDEFDIRRYTLFANVVVKDKLDVYTHTVEHMKARMADITNKIYMNLGLDHPSSPSVPLSIQMEGAQIVKTFLDVIFMSVLTFLVILSILLIYSLMLGDVEEKTYEFGMLRALGLKHKTLTAYLLMQAASFAVPGLLMGLFVSYLFNTVTAYFIGNYAGLPVDTDLHPYAILTGILLGTLMPLISMYFPVKRAMSQTLKDSLDLYHRVISNLTITILKLEKLGLSPPQLIAALMMVIAGFMTYYIVPLAFQLGKLEIFLYLLNIILIVMILGLTFLANLLQKDLENWIARGIVWVSVRDRPLMDIVCKNLQGHQRRNWKTALMFCIALSFVIFSGVMFTLQGKVLKNTLMMTFGSDLWVRGPDDQKGGLKEFEIRNWIDNIYSIENPDKIESYTFMSFPLGNMEDIDSTQISPLSGFPSVSTTIIAVEENYLETVFQEFYIPIEFDDYDYPKLENGEKDMVAGLYSYDGLTSYNGKLDYYDILNGDKSRIDERESITSELWPITMIVPSGIKEYLSIDTDTPVKIRIESKDWDDSYYFRGRIRGMAQKIPGFAFSGYRFISFSSTTLVSYPQMYQLLNVTYGGVWPEILLEDIPADTSYGIPKQSMLIKLKDGVGKKDREIIANGVRTFFRDDTTMMFDVIDLLGVMELTVLVMEMFFLFVGALALVLAFFLLWTSFSSNVRENSWEYGVLRAIGLTDYQCMRIYIYEAVALILAATILGSIVGILVAVTVTLQFNLFTELPFSMEVIST
jgi:ABC-type antimicrobial peptide transport system permease subunit